MRRPIQTLFLATFALVASVGAAAASQMVVTVNESRHVALRGSAANVVVGDPRIADVFMTDAHSIFVRGLGFGTTQVMVTDAAGRTLMNDAVTVVSPDGGHITLYRGPEASEFGCDRARCHPMGAPAPSLGGSAGGSASVVTDSAPADSGSGSVSRADMIARASGEAGAAARNSPR